jgi:hypothetical protein
VIIDYYGNLEIGKTKAFSWFPAYDMQGQAKACRDSGKCRKAENAQKITPVR